MKNTIAIKRILEMKKRAEKITCLTAYDASFARVMEEQGIDAILVGDSLGMVMQGGQDTLKVSMENMVYHTSMVRKGVKETLLIADLPYQSYENVETTLFNAERLLNEGGADMVKLEGGSDIHDQVLALTGHDIAVCGHLGLQPQSVHKYGGYKIQGRNQEEAEKILHDARLLEKAGVKMIVLECIPRQLAKEIAASISIPTIGIGAGVECDGQVLVIYDVIGISGYIPKMANNFLKDSEDIADAIQNYISQVRSGSFPTLKQSFD